LDFVQRANADKSRELAVTVAAESFSHIPTDRIRCVVNLGTQLQIGAEGRLPCQPKDFRAVLVCGDASLGCSY